jgi:hypothetical protein
MKRSRCGEVLEDVDRAPPDAITHGYVTEPFEVVAHCHECPVILRRSEQL